MKKIILLLLVCLSIQAQAGFSDGGDRVGNGGDVVVCGDKVELLDVYETRLRGHKLKSIQQNAPYEMVRELIASGLKKVQPLRSEKYEHYLNEFEAEAEFLPNIELKDIDDTGVVAIPQGCILKQIAVQLSDGEIRPGDKRYIVSLDLWNKLDSYNKMALVLHELIFREQREQRKSSSMTVRGLVSQIIREKTDALSIFTLYVKDGIRIKNDHSCELYNVSFVNDCTSMKTTQSAGVIKLEDVSYYAYYGYNGFNFRLVDPDSLTIDTTSGLLSSVNEEQCKYTAADEENVIGEFKVTFPKNFVSCGKKMFLQRLNNIPHATLKSPFYTIELTEIEELNFNNYLIFSGKFRIEGEKINSNGQVEAQIIANKITVAQNQPLSIMIAGQEWKSSEIDFIQNGNMTLAKATAEDIHIKFMQLDLNGEISVDPESYKPSVEFSPDGKIFSASGHKIKLKKSTSLTFKKGLMKKTAVFPANKPLSFRFYNGVSIESIIDGETKWLAINPDGKITVY